MITYSSVISYFQEFADKHIQLNSFSYGALDKLELKKINEYPALHIILTNTDISDKVVSYDFDVYVFSGIAQQSEEDEQVKESAYTDTLMILQDLRAEFTEGKYIVNTNKLLLQGSNELSCTPIEERFNNMVIGFSTSLSVQSANETTACTIPYPKYNGENIFETWNNINVTIPTMANFDSGFYWWSATENVQNTLTYTNNGVASVGPLFNSNYLTNNLLTFNDTTLSTAIRYNTDFRGFDFKGALENYYLQSTINTYNDKQLYVVLKVKNIGNSKAGLNNLLAINNSAGTEGTNLYVGGTTSSSPNQLVLKDIASSNTDTVQIISDGSNDYIREGSITIGVAMFGSSMLGGVANTCKVYLNGIQYASLSTDADSIDRILIGNNTGIDSKFVLQECYIQQINDTTSDVGSFPKLMSWLKNR